MKWFEKIHHQAVKSARQFKRSEYELLLSIQAVDAKKVYRKIGYGSLFEYCVKALGLPEGSAYSFIRVARKSLRLPQVKAAIREGRVSVSQAKRVLSVVTESNQKEWLDKAENLTQRELEKEVASVNPKEAVTEQIRPVAVDQFKLQCGVNSVLESKIQRVKEVLSQKKKRPVSLEEALEAAVELYLEKQDPLEKAKRATKRITKRTAPPRSEKPASVIPAGIRHQVLVRHQGSGTWIDPKGKRCASRYFVDVHHKVPRSRGGDHTLDNLTLLCKAHHLLVHDTFGNKPPPSIGR